MRFLNPSIILFLICLCFSEVSLGQYAEEKKELEDKLSKCQEDTNKVKILNKLSVWVAQNNFIEAYTYAKKAIELADKLGFIKGKVNALNNLGDAYWYHADYIKAQDNYFKAYKINDSS